MSLYMLHGCCNRSHRLMLVVESLLSPLVICGAIFFSRSLFFSWIPALFARLELKPIHRRWVLFALSGNINELGIPLMSFLIFTTYVYTGHDLTASKAFIVLSLLGTLRVQVFLLQVFANILCSEAYVGLKRIQVRVHPSPGCTWSCHVFEMRCFVLQSPQFMWYVCTSFEVVCKWSSKLYQASIVHATSFQSLMYCPEGSNNAYVLLWVHLPLLSFCVVRSGGHPFRLHFWPPRT